MRFLADPNFWYGTAGVLFCLWWAWQVHVTARIFSEASIRWMQERDKRRQAERK